MSGSKSLKKASCSVVDRIAENEHRYCMVSSSSTGWRGRGLFCQGLEAADLSNLNRRSPLDGRNATVVSSRDNGGGR